MEEGSGGFTDIGDNPAHDANIECLVAVGITLGPLVLHLNALSVVGFIIVALASRAWL